MRVHLEEATEDAVGRRRDEHRREGRRKPDPHEHRRAQEEREDLEAEAEARHPRDKAVRHDAPQQDRAERKQMVPQHHALPGQADVEGELLRRELRRPEEVGVVHEDDGDETRRRTERGRVAEVGPQSRRKRLTRGRRGGTRRGLTTVAFPQSPDEEHAKQGPGGAEGDEHVPPAAEEPERPGDDEPRHHQANVERGLVDGKR